LIGRGPNTAIARIDAEGQVSDDDVDPESKRAASSASVALGIAQRANSPHLTRSVAGLD
jgi:hypothetical protein